jgi:hypothetical protein
MRALEMIWEIFFCSFSNFFLCEASGRCFWDVWTVILYVRTVFLVVRTIRLIRPDVHSFCPNERVFAIFMWHYVWTPLKFRLDGEPCRVKSHSPCAAAHFFAPFGSFCRLVRVPYDFYGYFSRVRVIFAVSLHPRYIFNTLLLISFKFLCLKYGVFGFLLC